MPTRKAEKRQEAIEDLVRRMNAGTGTSDRTYRVVLESSEIGGTARQRATLRCLGLHRRGSSSLVKDSPQTRGRIRAVAHLVRVEESS
jgi:large subunit ribosomal protein L30